MKAEGGRLKPGSLGLVAVVVSAGVLLALSGTSVAHAQALTPATPISVTVPILMYHHVGDVMLEGHGAIGARYDILCSAAEWQRTTADPTGAASWHGSSPWKFERVMEDATRSMY